MPFTYMGTKRQIVSSVVSVVANAKSGPFLDLFSGISTVGVGVAPARQIWCNDAQGFAHLVATAKFTSKQPPIIDARLISSLVDQMNVNSLKLMRLFGDRIHKEDVCLHEAKIEKIGDLITKQLALSASSAHQRLRESMRISPRSSPYCLFSISYVGGYVGVRQAVDLDSLRFAIDALREARIIDADQHRWFVLALCKSLFAVANTTGHFAQYLDVKPTTLKRFLAKRRRSVLAEWLRAMRDLQPVGAEAWRKENRTFRGDATELLKKLKRKNLAPAVIYADPPYTGDQYSRYYHLLETMLDYDYPDMSGKGQYRPDRFVSNFSIKTKVAEAFDGLISGVAELGSELIVNYPEYGLLEDTKASMLAVLGKYYHRVNSIEIAHEHSSLGASKGIERAAVTELIFHAR